MIHFLLSVLASTSSPCAPTATTFEPRRLTIEILYLDMTECTRCVDTGARVDEAVALLAPVLGETGWEVRVEKIHVASEELARKHRFASSPTVRINGRDVQFDSRETVCGDCGKLCKDASVACREWRYRDQWFTSPPKALFVEAILAAMSNQQPAPQTTEPFEVPQNLKRFFATKKASEKNAAESRPGCCSGAETAGAKACCSGPETAGSKGCCESKPAGQSKPGCCQGQAGDSAAKEPCCTLTAESRATRKDLLKELAGGFVERRDLANGLAFRFESGPGVVNRLARAIDLERDCCQFLTFGLRVEENHGPVWLEITGPASARKKIEEYFGPR